MYLICFLKISYDTFYIKWLKNIEWIKDLEVNLYIKIEDYNDKKNFSEGNILCIFKNASLKKVGVSTLKLSWRSYLCKMRWYFVVKLGQKKNEINIKSYQSRDFALLKGFIVFISPISSLIKKTMIDFITKLEYIYITKDLELSLVKNLFKN